MITRKLGKLLRGNATPFQLVAACVLGALIGFAPSPLQAPALLPLLVALTLVTNANLGMVLMAAGLARLLAFALAPISFQLGRFLLDGPTSELARAAVNAPVLAWCGLQYYAVTGGLLVAAVVGTVAGVLLARAVGGFRRRMLAAAQTPARWSELSAKPWARAAIWLFFGKEGKGTWEDRLARRVGNPIRVWGAALVLVAVVGTALGHRALSSSLARRGMQSGLERANGATVDLGPVQLDLSEGRLGVSLLALADPNDLGRDLFRADLLEADVDQVDFLRRRVHLARVAVKEASSGSPREVPGVRIERPVEDVPDTEDQAAPGEGEMSIEQVLAEGRLWKERLGQARHWLDRLAPEEAGVSAASESLAERLEREVREMGWLSVEADHLVTEAPTFRLSELVVEGFALAWLPEHTFDLSASELSTHPWLVDAPPRLELASRDGNIHFEVDLAPASRGGGAGVLRMSWRELSVDAMLAKLKLPGPAPLSGGTLDLELDGSWPEGRIGFVDLPLVVTLRDTLLTIEGLEPTPLDELELSIGISGPIDAPRIRFDASAFADALADAGKRELARQVRGRVESEIQAQLDGELGEQLESRLGVELPESAAGEVGQQAAGLLNGVLGGKR